MTTTNPNLYATSRTQEIISSPASNFLLVVNGKQLQDANIVLFFDRHCINLRLFFDRLCIDLGLFFNFIGFASTLGCLFGLTSTLDLASFLGFASTIII
jgi:hypothetical protein